MGPNNIENSETWKTLDNDSYLSQFLNFTKDNEENASAVSGSLTACEQLNRLTKGINLLDKELQSLVHHNYGSLISQGTWVEEFGNTLTVLQTDFRNLLVNVTNLRNKIVEPYNEIEKQSQILTRLHDTSNIVRCITQIRQLSKHLSQHDMFKASALIKEIDDFSKDVDLSDVDVLENEKRIVEETRQQIRRNGNKALIEALTHENEPQAASCIQLFMNLNVLDEIVKNLKQSALQTVDQGLKSALDLQSLTNQSTDQEKIPKYKNIGPGRVTGATFPGVNVAAFRAKLWSNWENLLDDIVYPKCVQMYILSLSISKQQHSALHSEVSDLKMNDLDVVCEFWNQITDSLSKKLIAASEESSFIKQALEGEYPKLLRLHTDLNKKLKMLMKKHPFPSMKNAQQLFSSDNHFADQFENAYLSRSVSRLLDGVHDMFSNEGLPSNEEMDTFIRQISNELGVSLVDENLCKTVVRNIGKAIRLFCIKSEQGIVHDGNSSQVIGAANSTQQLNTSIANNAHYLKLQIENIMSKMSTKLPEYCKSDIIKSFEHIDELERNIMEPIMTSLSEAIESIILTIHRENFQPEVSQDPISCSLYLRELQNFISRAYTNYLEPFKNQNLSEKYCLQLANRCVELFIRHVCLVRPIHAGGRQKLSEDFNKIEIAVTPLCSQVNNLGDNFKILRALRPLASCTDPQQVVNNELVGKIIPYSLALMLLFSFAPTEIPSPHESCSWSTARMSQWLDNHKSERERLELISGALQKYQQTIRQQNRTTFHEIYPIMMGLLESGFESLKQRKEN